MHLQVSDAEHRVLLDGYRRRAHKAGLGCRAAWECEGRAVRRVWPWPYLLHSTMNFMDLRVLSVVNSPKR